MIKLNCCWMLRLCQCLLKSVCVCVCVYVCECGLAFSWRIFNFGRCDIYGLKTKSSPVKSCCRLPPFLLRPSKYRVNLFLVKTVKLKLEQCARGVFFISLRFISLFHCAPRSGNKHSRKMKCLMRVWNFSKGRRTRGARTLTFIREQTQSWKPRAKVFCSRYEIRSPHLPAPGQ